MNIYIYISLQTVGLQTGRPPPTTDIWCVPNMYACIYSFIYTWIYL